jgi:hypothetical protein
MIVIQAEGRLDDLKRMLTVPGVMHMSRGATPVGGERYRATASIEESAIPQIEALGCIVTVVVTQEQIDSPPAPEE